MPGQNVIIRTEGFQVKESTETDDDLITLEGLAVPYEKESRNGIIYSEESLKNSYKTLEGQSFLYNHDPDQVLGSVENVEVAEDGLRFTAKLDKTKEKVRDIKKGFVKTVSIQAMVDEAKEGPDNRVDVQEFLELSAAPIPGFKQAQATAAASAVSIEEYMAEKEQDRKGEPFAGYDDFDDCVSQNQDKSDPEAYCAAIKRQVEDEEAESLEDLDLVPTDEMKEQVDKVLKWKQDGKVPDDCGTRTGWERANQIQNKENLSPETVGRMVSFFARHEDNKDVDEDKAEWEDCGYVMWLAWGGDPGREWAERKQAAIEAREQDNENFNDINGESTVTNQENLGNISERDLHGVIASAYDGMDVSDTISFFDQADYVGISERQFGEMLADAYDVTTGDVLEWLEELSNMTDEEENVENDGCEECEDSQEESQEEQEMDLEMKIDQMMEMMEEMLNQVAGSESEESDEDSSETSEESVGSKQPVGAGSNTEKKMSADKLANEIF